MPAVTRIGPTDPQARLRSVDAVRGFALFGVLLVNMYNFGADAHEWTGTVDRAFSTLMHSVFETKSWRLFSLLFGFGFALQLARVMSRPGGSLWFYFRRLLILFVFGMAHALFFDGDILMEYAMLGLILIVFRNVRGHRLLILACILLLAFPLGNLIHTESADEMVERWEDELPLAEMREDHPYLGSPMDVVLENVAAIPPPIWSEPVYLSGTVMFTTLFYGYGFGQLFLLGPAATTAYAILFFVLQLLFCTWWLDRFRFGPAEWLWRSLIYLKPQPLRL